MYSNSNSNPNAIANTIIKRFYKDGLFITPNKLYSMIYLLYEEFLYQTQTKLFNDTFIIYENKVVLPTVYFKFDCYKNNFIKTYATDALDNIYFAKGDAFNTCLETVYNQYKFCTDEELIAITTDKNIAFRRCKEKKTDLLNDIDIIDNNIKKKEDTLKKAKTKNHS